MKDWFGERPMSPKRAVNTRLDSNLVVGRRACQLDLVRNSSESLITVAKSEKSSSTHPPETKVCCSLEEDCRLPHPLPIWMCVDED